MGLKVGILGGDYLARMLALAGYPLSMTFRVLDPAPEACAGQVVPDRVVAGFDDEAALKRFADGLHVVTYEWENVPVDAVRYLSRFVRVAPSLEALEIAQDRFLEKSLFRKLGIETAPFAPVDSIEDLTNAVRVIGLPAVLKTRRLGCDGKGQYKLETGTDIEQAWKALGGVPSVVESSVPFERELSILAVRREATRDPDFEARRILQARRAHREDASQQRAWRLRPWVPPQMEEVKAEIESRREVLFRRRNPLDPPTWIEDFYPLVENVHRDGILRTSRAPATEVSRELQAEAEEIASRVMEATGYSGVLAIELFEHEGRLLANEMAPRVHNSGHWTIEGAETSQFENHLRAVCGLPLGSTAIKGYSAMVNLVGLVPESEAVLRVPGAHLHLYGKEPRPGRQVGHITVRADEPSAIDAALSQITPLIEKPGEQSCMLPVAGKTNTPPVAVKRGAPARFKGVS